MAKEGTIAIVAELPMCDVCKLNGDDSVPAQYDGKTKSGPWANMCVTHFTLHGTGLGTGKGQKFVLEADTYREGGNRPTFFCEVHGIEHPLVAQWVCYDTLLTAAIAQAEAEG